MSEYELTMVARTPRASGPPQLTAVGEVKFGNCTYTHSMGRPGQIQVGIDYRTLNDNQKARLNDLRRNPTELWLYRGDRVEAAGIVTNYGIQGYSIVPYCHGLLYYLRYMFVTQNLRFDKVDQFQIAARLINHWQDQSWGNFGIVTSGVGNSGVVRDRQYDARENHNIAEKLEQLSEVINGFDYYIDPHTRRLVMGYPQLGTDKSHLVIFDRRNISSADIQVSIQAGEIASDAYGTGVSQNSEGVERVIRSHQFNDDVRRTFGRTGIADVFDGVSVQGTLNGHTQKLLADRDEALFMPGPGLIPVAGVDVDDFGLGDTITYSFDAGLGTQTIVRRVLEKSVSITEHGRTTISVGLS